MKVQLPLMVGFQRRTCPKHRSLSRYPTPYPWTPQDKFLSSAGQESGRMASFSVNPDSGELTPLETYPLGNRPAWVSITELPG